MEQRLTMVTLGVADVPRAKEFYERLGFKPAHFPSDDVAFYHMGATVLGLYGRKALAKEAGVSDDLPGFSGVTLAWNARSEAEVDTTLAELAANGARIIKPAEHVFWGGYSGYFADPDGHIWEVAYNPIFPLDEDGVMQLPTAPH